MDDNKKSTDILESLFRQMPEEELPVSFRLNVMQQITRETVRIKKRNEWLGLAAVIAASLGILGMAIASIFYYMGLPEITWPQITWPKIDFSAFCFYFHIGILTLILLFLDYKLRKAFHKGE